MTKNYIDRGSSAAGIPQELINVFDETVFEYSKKIYNFLINKLEKVGVPFTDEGIINIEKIYEIISFLSKILTYDAQIAGSSISKIIEDHAGGSPRPFRLVILKDNSQ